MTTAVFIKRDKDTVGFKISGHSGFADKGFDIVCASISSAAYLTINLLSQIDKNAKIKATVKCRLCFLKAIPKYQGL